MGIHRKFTKIPSNIVLTLSISRMPTNIPLENLIPLFPIFNVACFIHNMNDNNSNDVVSSLMMRQHVES